WAPTDNVFGTSDGITARFRITAVEIMDGWQQYTMVHDRQSTYTSDVEGVPVNPPTIPPSGVVGPTFLLPLDIPLITDADDSLGLIGYLAVAGVTDAWQGASIEISYDGGQNFVNLAQASAGAL